MEQISKVILITIIVLAGLVGGVYYYNTHKDSDITISTIEYNNHSYIIFERNGYFSVLPNTIIDK